MWLWHVELHTCNPSTQEVEQEDQHKFKVNPIYTMTSMRV